jgi:hypothetical protein
VRLSSPQPGQMIGEPRVAAAGPAELLPGDRVTLLVDLADTKIIRFTHPADTRRWLRQV